MGICQGLNCLRVVEGVETEGSRTNRGLYRLIEEEVERDLEGLWI
jgi:hypothetical protein